jgi:hypothetical protein
MARHANSPSGPGKPTAEETSAVKEQEGRVESTSESDQVGKVEGAGETAGRTEDPAPDDASAERPRDGGNRK